MREGLSEHGMSVQIFQRLKTLFKLCILLAWLAGCATYVPVQEMSNARQTIAAALEVQAEAYSPTYLETAEKLMAQASAALETGDYILAKEYAVSAQHYAIKARQQAISRRK